MSTLSELIAQRDALQAQIENARTEGIREAFAKIREVMEANQITADQLVQHFAPKGKRAGNPGGTVAPKYRNPQTGESWSGRGLQPRWLKAATAAGRRLEEFAIPSAQVQ